MSALRRLLGVPVYVVWLAWKVLLATLVELRSDVSRELRSTPCIFEHPLRVRSDLAVALLCCSITTTPGTLVVAVSPGDGHRRRVSVFVHSMYGSVEDARADVDHMEDRLMKALGSPSEEEIA